MERVGLVGCSSDAEVLSMLLGGAGTQIAFWDPDEARQGPKGEHIERVALEALRETPLIFFCVDIERARVIGRHLGDVITGSHVLVHTSRELEPETLKTVSQVLREETATHRFGLLTGPMVREDIEAGLVSAASCASRFPEVHTLLQECLITERFRLYRTEDILGAEIAATYTRVIAFVMGVARGMQQGPSVDAILFARGLAEIGRFIAERGGVERTVFGMAGAGNLFADARDPGSVDYRMGLAALRQGDFRMEEMREAFGTAAGDLARMIDSLYKESQSGRADMSIFRAAHGLVVGSMGTPEAVQFLMTLPVLQD